MTKTCERDGEKRTAIFSDCEKYRYTLEIVWSDMLHPEPKLMQVIGLNPSTATHEVDDPTIRRCKAFARREGCNRLVMTNLFAWRDTSPEKMKQAAHPIGEAKSNHLGPYNENNLHLLRVASNAAVIVAAWGNHGTFQKRGLEVAKLISNLKCFRLTGVGEPEHPLYMPANQPLVPFCYP